MQLVCWPPYFYDRPPRLHLARPKTLSLLSLDHKRCKNVKYPPRESKSVTRDMIRSGEVVSPWHVLPDPSDSLV